MKPDSVNQLKHAIETVERAGRLMRQGLYDNAYHVLAQLSGELQWMHRNEVEEIKWKPY